MRNRIGMVGILSVMCALALTFGVLTGCTPGGGNDKYLFAAEVDLLPGGNMQALVACVPEGEYFPVDGSLTTVTVNGEPVPPWILGNYSNSLTAVSQGDNVTLHFAYKDMNVQKTLTMPAAPNITTALVSFDSTLPKTIAWDPILPTPDSFAIMLPSSATVSGDTFTEFVSGNSTSYVIPGGTLLASTPFLVTVEALNKTSSLGSSAMPGSVYMVGNQDQVSMSTDP
jgi:hypothetical protein